MPELNICLLVSNDPDDHQILCEAIKEVAKDAAILIMVEIEHLLPLIKSKLLVPSRIIIDPVLDPKVVQLVSDLQVENDFRFIFYSEVDIPESLQAQGLTVSKRLPFSQLVSKLGEIFGKKI